MSMLSIQINELREMADKLGFNGVSTGDIAKLMPMLREAADTIEGLRDRLQAVELGSGTCEVSYEQDGVPRCSECQNVLYDEYKDGIKNYCDECGRRVER